MTTRLLELLVLAWLGKRGTGWGEDDLVGGIGQETETGAGAVCW